MRVAMVLFTVGIALGVSVSPLAFAPGTMGDAAAAAPGKAVPVDGGVEAGGEGTAAGEVASVVSNGGDGCRPRMPLRRRAAQTLVVGMPDVTRADDSLAVELTGLGVGGVFLNDANVASAEQVAALTAGLREASRLPLMVATDEEGGRVSTLRPLIGVLPSARALAATSTASEIRRAGKRLGRTLRSLGIDTDFAPVADLDAGPSNGLIGDRSFSADPITATRATKAFARGLAAAGVAPVVKHFPGHGRAGGDVHSDRSVVDDPVERLLASDVVPFAAAVDAGAPVVMLGHVTYSALDAERPASLSPAAYALLRDTGFDGVAMTDSLGMGAVHRRWGFSRATVRAVGAGADAVLVTDGRHARSMTRALVKAVRSGRLSEERLNEAAGRMLALKGRDARRLACADVAAPRGMGARLPRD